MTRKKAGVAVFGVNPGSAGTHKKFSEKHGFDYPLLADPDPLAARMRLVPIG